MHTMTIPTTARPSPFLMMHADDGRPKERRRKDDVAALRRIHFPVGGPRFRPCIEEFGVETAPGYAAAIHKGREDWRRIQIRTVVRDSPEDAADALRELGYTVETPAAGRPATNVEKMRAY